ncbi:MAG: Hsp20/alpha crystallin family protein [candidate division Zixibacteria bacterium]|nr:Hsp20/alpha crystallin family protein [candidate division Zixibacteria bacterium]
MTYLTFKPKKDGLNRQIDRLFNDFFSFPTVWAERDSDFVPRVNIIDGKDNIALTFELPGMKKEDIKVTIKDNVLNISGKREFSSEEKDENYVRTEISTGSFCRSFTLPDTVNSDKISADYKDGMLTVKLAKLEEVKPKEIDVRIS